MKLTEIPTTTDKGPDGHNYLSSYEALFEPIRETAERLLEIGVWRGESIELWRAYFPDHTVVTGYDIHIQPPVHTVEGPNVVLRECNAYDDDVLATTPLQDIIIDDGPHTLGSMLYVASHYSRLVRDGGVLVIEDVPHDDWVPQIVESFPPELREHVSLIDLRESAKTVTGDDRLIVMDLR